MTAPSPLLALRDLEVWSGDRLLLQAPSLDLLEGERVLLVGPSGAGKSLFMDLLLGFVGPGTAGLVVRGEIRLEGQDLLRRPPEARDGRMGAVFQLHRLGLFDDLTAAENLAFGSSDAGEARAAAAALGVGDLDRPAPLCSGGERLRVAMARTLLRGAGVLLLDEPTTGLDAAARVQVVDAIRRSHRRLTLVVTHDEEAFDGFPDVVLRLDPGSRTLRRGGPEPRGGGEAGSPRPPGADGSPLPQPRPAPRPGPGVRLLRGLDRLVLSVADGAADAVATALAPLAALRIRHPLDGPRVRRELRRDLSLGVAAFTGLAAMLVALTATYFLFDRLPRRDYTEALVQDDLLAGLGLILSRVAVPLVTSILLAAKLGASSSAHLGQMSFSRQVDALRLLRVPLRRHLLLPAAFAQLAAAWVHTAVAVLVAYGTGAVVFLATHAGWSAAYVHRSWWKEVHAEDLPWLAAKVGISALAVAATSFRVGIAPKRAPEEVVRGIHATLLRGLLLVLAVHAAFAFLEF